MTYYEYIKSLSKNEIIILLLYMCINTEMLKSGFRVKNYRWSGLLFRLCSHQNINIKKTNVDGFLSQDYDGKTVYQYFQDMSLQEMSGVLGLLAVSERAREDVLFGGNAVHILEAKLRPSKKVLRWLGREIVE